MKYAVEMGSGTMIYNIKFDKQWFYHSEVDKENTQTHRMEKVG
jgi:hypothetical protein